MEDIETWRNHIMYYAKTEEAAKDLIKQLAKTNWSQYTQCSRCHKAVGTKALLAIPHEPMNDFIKYGKMCIDCYQHMRNIIPYDCCLCQNWYGDTLTPPREFDLCPHCSKTYTEEISQVKKQLARAKNAGVPYTLTPKEWLTTIQYFNNLCVYCQKNKSECSEHYIPITRGGGTTQINCFPACGKCNRVKNNKLPEQFERLFPSANIQRIKEYIAKCG